MLQLLLLCRLCLLLCLHARRFRRCRCCRRRCRRIRRRCRIGLLLRAQACCLRRRRRRRRRRRLLLCLHARRFRRRSLRRHLFLCPPASLLLRRLLCRLRMRGRRRDALRLEDLPELAVLPEPCELRLELRLLGTQLRLHAQHQALACLIEQRLRGAQPLVALEDLGLQQRERLLVRALGLLSLPIEVLLLPCQLRGVPELELTHCLAHALRNVVGVHRVLAAQTGEPRRLLLHARALRVQREHGRGVGELLLLLRRPLALLVHAQQDDAADRLAVLVEQRRGERRTAQQLELLLGRRGDGGAHPHRPHCQLGAHVVVLLRHEVEQGRRPHHLPHLG